MTLDEAIKHCEEVASRMFDDRVHCIKCAEVHKQLAEWLKDYKRLLEQESKTEKVIKMRDATPEEQEAIAKYIKSISKPTGVEFDIDIDKKVESYGKLLKHPVVKHIMDEEQEPCEDAISRQAVLDMIEGFIADATSHGISARLDPYYVMNGIKYLPSVKPQEPKTVIYSGDGYADGEMVYDMAECPNCGYEYEDGDKDWGLPFCPNCGQKLNWERSE